MFSPDEFPNRFDHAEAQSRIYALWEEGGYFHSEPDKGREAFTIVIPPPNVTGALHLGHALNNTLQDILIRTRRMQGFNALWMPGADHAGIATQAVVERRLKQEENQTRHDLGREKLVERIWQWKDQYEARIIEQLKRMGCSCDWERWRFTLDPVCARAVRHTFFDLFSKKLIYRGKRLVNWDTFLQTAVSDDEVFHDEVDGHFWSFRYPVLEPKSGEPEFVVIATTRPETMLGDTAVAVHPDPAAALDRAKRELQEKLAKAPGKEKPDIEKELDNIQERRRTMLPHLEKLCDMARDGRQVMLPLLDRPIPLVADEWARPELGSGCVKITPAHDPNDYEIGQRQRLPKINILNPDGTLNENAGTYQGLKVMEARKRVVADLDERGLLAGVEDRKIDLAHSDRSKTPIEPYLADQWFVKMEELAQSAMDAVTDGRVQIFPPRYAKGYVDWLAEKRDWPVGRQLWWGHRIPIWSQSCADEKSLSKLLADLENDPQVEEGLVAYDIERSDDSEEAEPGAPFATLRVCILDENADVERRFDSRGYQQEEDVLDTWFSSALWPHSTLGWPEKTPELAYYYPTSTLITSRDIITLWVARMVLTGLNNVGDVPFREVFIHPKILDRYGETMSKSKGNGVDPLDVIDKFGPDALRFGLAYITTETQDVRMTVQFECPHCESLIDQTKENREKPRITCSKCGKPFSTQWAAKEEDQALPRGAVVSEQFELGRNFCNKLWNAARFALINFGDYQPAPVADGELEVEDRWILSRLATVTQQVTDALNRYRYADAARTLYDFAWDEFCSYYLEMVKSRLQDDAQRPVASRILAYTLDNLLRLLHPITPFITEEIWRLLNKAAPQRGLDEIVDPIDDLIVAPWPEADLQRQDQEIEARFARFQTVLAAVREIRARQNIPPRKPIEFSVRCEESEASLLRPMAPYFSSMAQANPFALGPAVTPPPTHAKASLPGLEIYVNMEGFIDVAAEKQKLEKEREKIDKLITGKEKKLENQQFVEKAPADVVQRERESLAELKQQLNSIQTALVALSGKA
ncbi:MAG: valine--tRNA ligase [Planctomycetes bacterium]|nr:valine--tRNA ligase [Planctomycetota bacterium]